MTIIERLQALGIRRLGDPKHGFQYRTAQGAAASAADRARIEALKIPPAWKDVAIHPQAGGSVQAVGMDAAGRWQYLYHEKQILIRERKKLDRMIRFLRALPRMRKIVNRDLSRPGMPRERVMAGIVRILSSCYLRPGSEVYASENGSYGIATLRPKHLKVVGDVLHFDFPGKSGQRQVREVRDRRVAKLVRELLRHPGEVFKYRNEDGVIVDVKTRHINAYIQEHMGERFSAKDFRTWAGTLLCACALARTAEEARLTPTARKRTVAAALRHVAQHLGNTPAVCRSSYVFPVVLQRFEEGRVLRYSFNGDVRRAREVERSERALLRLLAEAPRRRSSPGSRGALRTAA
jgi:DNA topoisomerase-1